MRYPTMRKHRVRFVVFTGTSGKTLARNATTFMLRHAGHRVIHPPFGYTNELGIVLAALGIESVTFFSWKGLKEILHSVPEQDTLACVEIGADWYPDIPWFVRRYSPYGICMTNIATDTWTRGLDTIWKEKQMLIDHLSDDGFVVFSRANESIERIHALDVSKARTYPFTVATEDAQAFVFEATACTYTYVSPVADFTPHIEAFGAAFACGEVLDPTFTPAPDVFATYTGVPERFTVTTLLSGATLITDTYKAVPQCTEYVLRYALALPQKHRIAVISEMRPLTQNIEKHYARVAELLRSFDRVYFIGPSATGALLAKDIPTLSVIDSPLAYPELGKTLQELADTNTVIVIKGSQRYHLNTLVSRML